MNPDLLIKKTMESDGEKGFDPFANDPNLEVYYFLMFCSIRTYLQIIRKTHLVCILLIILSIFKVQLDFSLQGSKTALQLMHKANVLDSQSTRCI